MCIESLEKVFSIAPQNALNAFLLTDENGRNRKEERMVGGERDIA